MGQVAVAAIILISVVAHFSYSKMVGPHVVTLIVVCKRSVMRNAFSFIQHTVQECDDTFPAYDLICDNSQKLILFGRGCKVCLSDHVGLFRGKFYRSSFEPRMTVTSFLNTLDIYSGCAIIPFSFGKSLCNDIHIVNVNCGLMSRVSKPCFNNERESCCYSSWLFVWLFSNHRSVDLAEPRSFSGYCRICLTPRFSYNLFSLSVGIPRAHPGDDCGTSRNTGQAKSDPFDAYLLSPVRLGIGSVLFFGGMGASWVGIQRSTWLAVVGWLSIVIGFATAFQALISLFQ